MLSIVVDSPILIYSSVASSGTPYANIRKTSANFYIGDNLYTFLVVGVYDGAYNDMFIYTNALTMKEIYSKV